MKITIVYEYDPTFSAIYPFWAKCGSIAKCGGSFEAARASLIEDLRKLPAAPREIPPAEEIEIEPTTVETSPGIV